MPNSILLSALLAYAHWADSVREHDDMFRDDSVLPDLRSMAQLRRNALLNHRRTMMPLFEDLISAFMAGEGLSASAIRDAGSGYDSDSGLAYLSAVAVVNGRSASIRVEHDGRVSVTVL